MLTAVTIAMLVGLWALILWPRKPTDAQAIRDYQQARDAFARLHDRTR